MFYISYIVKTKTKTKKPFIRLAARRARRIVKMAVVPHAKNDYRPHLIRRYGMVAIVFTVIGMQMGYNEVLTGRVLGIKSTVTIPQLLEQTNRTRVSYGLNELKLNEKLNQAAYLKVSDMFTDQYWAHVAPDGTQPWKWFADAEYEYSEAGENLAKNFSTTGAAMTAWMNSPGHRANILNAEYQEVGFAMMDGELDGKPTSIIVALYGTPADALVASANTSFAQPEVNTEPNILTRFSIAAHSMTYVSIICLTLITFAIVIAGMSHASRKKLPRKLRQTWYHHHGLYKAAGLSVLSIAIFLLYSGGQI